MKEKITCFGDKMSGHAAAHDADADEAKSSDRHCIRDAVIDVRGRSDTARIDSSTISDFG